MSNSKCITINKLFVTLEGEPLLEICNHFSLTESSDENNIWLLIDENSEEENLF